MVVMHHTRCNVFSIAQGNDLIPLKYYKFIGSVSKIGTSGKFKLVNYPKPYVSAK